MLGRRRRLFIDRRQLTLLSINLAYVSAIVFIFCVILFAPPALVLYDSGSTFEEKDRAADHLLLLHKTVWPAFVVVLGLFFAHSLLYSHRITGPLYRFRKVFERVGDGDLTCRARLRDRDHLHPEADEINAMLDELAKRLARIRSREAAARAVARHARALAGRDGSLQAEEAHLDLGRRMDQLHEEIARFELPSDLEPEPLEAGIILDEEAASAGRAPGVAHDGREECAARAGGDRRAKEDVVLVARDESFTRR